MKRDEFYHAGEDVSDDGKTIVSVVNQAAPAGWASCWDKRVGTVPRDQVRDVVRLNENPELAADLKKAVAL